MNFDEIEKLIRLVADTNLAEVEIKRSGVHVRISRHLNADHGACGTGQPAAGAPPAWAAQPTAPPAVGASGAAAAPAAAASAAEDAGLHVITATMVGTFYRRPNPEAQPFVREGDTVRKGQVVCILEAMKILNEIECDLSGTVVKVFAEDAQPVEFGEKLFAIRPA